MLTECKVFNCANGTLGLHLSRAPWDPYPWVSSVQKGSSAENAGIHIGDTVIQLNDCDLLGQKILEIAQQLREHWQSGASYATIMVWRNKTEAACDYTDDDDDDDDDGDNDAKQTNQSQHQHSINQQSLQKFATCLQHIAQLLECPVCLEVIKPPSWQCCNGHVICNNCRSRSVKCPVCRVPLGPRGRCLLADQLFTLLAENFPCDGVTSKKSSSRDKDKCTPEYHNQPKMAFEKTSATATTTTATRMLQKNKNNFANNKTICQQEQQQQQHQLQQQQQQQRNEANKTKDKLNAIVIENENERQQPQKLSKKKTSNFFLK